MKKMESFVQLSFILLELNGIENVKNGYFVFYVVNSKKLFPVWAKHLGPMGASSNFFRKWYH